jgi:GNAT superfamily N-acetyltransferase
MTVSVAALAPEERQQWEILARGYKAFYKTLQTDEDYTRAWQRLQQRDGIFALGASDHGRLVGITHYLFHTAVWMPKVCYLQDLFVDQQVRGRGVARALIGAVAEQARSEGALRLYWHTQEHNATARLLYDKVAKFNGFLRYDYPL